MTNVLYEDTDSELPKGYHRDRYGIIKDDIYHQTITMEDITRVEAERAREARRARLKKAHEQFWWRIFWGVIATAVTSLLVLIGTALGQALGWMAMAILPGVVVAVLFLYGAGMAVQRMIALFKAKW